MEEQEAKFLPFLAQQAKFFGSLECHETVFFQVFLHRRKKWRVLVRVSKIFPGRGIGNS